MPTITSYTTKYDLTYAADTRRLTETVRQACTRPTPAG